MTEYVDTWHLGHTRNDRSLGQDNRDPASPKGKSKSKNKNESKNDSAYCVKTRKSENDTRQNEDEMSKLYIVFRIKS